MTTAELIHDFHKKVVEICRAHRIKSSQAKMLVYLQTQPEFTLMDEHDFIKKHKLRPGEPTGCDTLEELG